MQRQLEPNQKFISVDQTSRQPLDLTKIPFAPSQSRAKHSQPELTFPCELAERVAKGALDLASSRFLTDMRAADVAGIKRAEKDLQSGENAGQISAADLAESMAPLGVTLKDVNNALQSINKELDFDSKISALRKSHRSEAEFYGLPADATPLDLACEKSLCNSGVKSLIKSFDDTLLQAVGKGCSVISWSFPDGRPVAPSSAIKVPLLTRVLNLFDSFHRGRLKEGESVKSPLLNELRSKAEKHGCALTFDVALQEDNGACRIGNVRLIIPTALLPSSDRGPTETLKVDIRY